jgi:aspartyl-tRNA(Asn)/glutamyl-tRNA(Gln) amidotransferase subunit A
LQHVPETLTELAAALTARELSVVGLVERSLERIRRLDADLHAFVAVYAEHALRRARQLDSEWRRMAAARPLYGIPIALKDTFDLAGQPTLAGSRLLAGNFAARDAEVVNRLHAAGMIVIGKTHMTEFAFGGWGTNVVAGTPRNPWDLKVHRVPGGSSSGSGVAVAARMVPAALGTDTGGSVRIPAAMCGLVGFKPGAGRVSRQGVVPLAETLDCVGPLTLTVHDANLLYQVLSGELPPAARPPSRLRIAVLEESELFDVQPAVLRACTQAIDLFRGMGASAEPLQLGFHFEDLVRKNGVIMSYEGWRNHAITILRDTSAMDPNVYRRFAAGAQMSKEQYAEALRARLDDQAKFAARLTGFDALLTPATPHTAVPVDAVDEAKMPLNRYMRAVNYLGLVALSVPAALDEDGLPIAIQLIGLAGAEYSLLETGERFEALRGRFPASPAAANGPAQ